MIRARNHLLILVIVCAILGVSVYGNHMIQLNSWVEAHRAWQLEREAEMRNLDTSWLALAGLFWLPEGTATFGADPSTDVRLEASGAPAIIGRFEREGERVWFEPAAGVAPTLDGQPIGRVELKHDAGSDENPATTLALGSLRWWIIIRDGELGVRIKDEASPAWRAFEGIPSYPFSANWRVPARLIPFSEPRPMTYPTILGTTRTEDIPGVLQFEIGGQSFELLPLVRREGTQLWLMFGDKSNGESTYPAGRYLYVDMPADASGETVIDFNRAYNPPCAFTEFATCPLPLPQNKLPIGIYAGEKRYSKHENRE
jgi:hypothetical protein